MYDSMSASMIEESSDSVLFRTTTAKQSRSDIDALALTNQGLPWPFEQSGVTKILPYV